MDETIDDAGSGSTKPGPGEEESWSEEFEAMLDAMPTVDRLRERLARLQRRYQESLESDEPQADTMKEIAAEVEEIHEQIERLPSFVPPPGP